MRVFAYGRFYRVPGRTWERVLLHRGDRRARRLRDAELVVVGTGAAAREPAQIEADLTDCRTRGISVVSENTFLRRIGLTPTLPQEERPYSAADLAARSPLPRRTLDHLILFDVLEADEAGRFGFRALKAVAQAASLLERVSLADLALACRRIRETLPVEDPLAQLRVTADASGRIVLRAGDAVADLDGQLRLDLAASQAEAGALLADAADAREAGRGEDAERLFRRALVMSPRDPDVLFELGTLLCERGEFTEGLALLQKAAKAQPGFADAWYNIGHAYEQLGRIGEACGAYEKAAKADPNYPDPLYNLGMIALDGGRFPDAVDFFERYLRLEATGEWASRARKALALARMSLVKSAKS